MEFEFKKELGGEPFAELSMGHEAIARWINDELGSNTTRVRQLIELVEQVESQTKPSASVQGQYLKLMLDKNGVMVSSQDELDSYADEGLDEENMTIYDSESNAECGLPDFLEVIYAWLDFIQKP